MECKIDYKKEQKGKIKQRNDEDSKWGGGKRVKEECLVEELRDGVLREEEEEREPTDHLAICISTSPS